MGTFLRIDDMDKKFHDLVNPPTLLNYIHSSTTDEATAFNNLIMSVYDSDVMNTLPRCDCYPTPSLTGGVNIGAYCPNCRSHVKDQTNTDVEPLLWLETPKGCAPMILPGVLSKLSAFFTKKKFDVIRYLMDTSYRNECKLPGILEYLEAKGIQRGYRYFHDNYDFILESLFAHKLFKRPKGKNGTDPLMEFLTMNRHLTFVNHLPAANKTMLVLEENSTGRYRESSIEHAVNAARTVVGIDLPLHGYSTRMKENRVVKFLFLQIDYNRDYIDNCVRSKYGTIRKHTIASRSHWAYRAVIVSITDPHRYDEIYAPWGASVVMLRLHLINKLVNNYGLSQRESAEFLTKHTKKYHPLIDQLFKELIAEAGPKGIPVMMCRNPSLGRGSILLLWITKVKTDADDPTTSLGILVITTLNADPTYFLHEVVVSRETKLTPKCKKRRVLPHSNVRIDFRELLEGL